MVQNIDQPVDLKGANIGARHSSAHSSITLINRCNLGRPANKATDLDQGTAAVNARTFSRRAGTILPMGPCCGVISAIDD
jgi:hypothetical protein